MKRFLSAALCAALLLSLFLLPARAAGAPSTDYRVAAELGVLPQGQTEAGRAVSRGEFAKMLVAASPLRGTVSPAGNASPYRDVPYTHPCASSVKTAVDKGWMTGYLDGSFRPDAGVTAAEGLTALLALLGYGSGDLSGAYPDAQMALSASLGLTDGLSLRPGDGLRESDCAALFHHLLNAKAKETGKPYAEALGYALDKDGKLDVQAMLRTPTEGPFVVPRGGAGKLLPFSPAAVYRNDAPADLAALQPWDVLYYSKGEQTVWAYARKVSGTLEKVSPSREKPESVTVSGHEYKVEGDAARTQLGSGGGLSVGAVVTLLLGRDGAAAAAYAAEDLRTELIGLVTAQGSAGFTAANGSAYESPTLTLLGLDGQTYTVQTDHKGRVGSLVRASFTAEGTKVTALTQTRSVSGRVSASAGRIGKLAAAPDLQILDVSGGAAVKVYLSRLDGVTLDAGDVLYSEKNAAGELTALVLKGVTGDQYGYGVVLSAQEKSEDLSASGTYRVLSGGQETTYSLDRLLGAKRGPARIELSGGELRALRPLTELRGVESLSGVTLRAGGETHTVWDKAAALLYVNQQYRQIDRNELDPALYDIRAYCDAPDSEGGRVRILIATPR